MSGARSDAAVGPDPAKSRISIPDQSNANVAALAARFRSPEHGPDKVIIEVRRPHSDLRFLQTQNSVVVPRGLLKRDECNRVLATQLGVSSLRLVNKRKHFGAEQSSCGLHRLKHHKLSEYLAAV